MAGDTSTIVYRLESPLGDLVRVSRCEVVEALDEPYSMRVDLSTPEVDADLSAALGQDATLVIERSSHARSFRGVIESIRHLGTGQDQGLKVQLRIVPALWMLSLRRDTRMFQNKTVPDILEAVLTKGLSPYGRKVKLELEATYPEREHCLQYQESDLAFVHRLMEEEGISYAFDHAGDVEEMVLRDANASYPEAENAAVPVPYEPHDLSLATGPEPVHSFRRRHGTTTTKVTVRDFDWTLGGYVVEDSDGAADALGKTRESYEHGWGRSATVWSYSAPRYAENDAARQKGVRLEAHVEPAIVGAGTSRVIGFVPGSTFELAGHPVPELNAKYLLTRVTHLSASDLSAGQGESYHNRFECIPFDVVHRPARRTPKPRIPSVQTAIVTGPSGEEIHTDEHGRIKVQFHWDRESPKDDTSSCWVRVQQKWAGSGWGFWWLPRIGMEVIVQFIDGDPDRPLATGCVFNGENATPYSLPDDKTKSTIKSNSSPGGGGSNELRFEDKAGSEEIFTHAQKDYNEVVENDHNTLVHHDQSNTVDVDQTQHVKVDQTEEVGANQTMTVDGDRTVHVKGNFDEKVDGTETRHVAGAVSETFSANEARTIASDVTETINASETRTVGGSQTETISGSHDQTILAASDVTISGSLTQTVVGGITQTTPATWTIDAAGGLTITAPGGMTINAPGGIRFGAPAGVQHVDTFVDFLCGLVSAEGAWHREIVLAKMETIGVYVGIVQTKAESGIVTFPSLGLEVKQFATKMRAWAIRNKSGAVAVSSGPESTT